MFLLALIGVWYRLAAAGLRREQDVDCERRLMTWRWASFVMLGGTVVAIVAKNLGHYQIANEQT